MDMQMSVGDAYTRHTGDAITAVVILLPLGKGVALMRMLMPGDDIVTAEEMS